MRQKSDAAILSFSCGKDSIACWLKLREFGFTVHPYILELIPGLSFVDEGIRYFEDFFGTPILRLIHPSLPRMLDNYVFQPPDRCRKLWDLDLPSLDYEDIEEYVRMKWGKGTPIAVGTRQADSPMRRTAIKMHGSVNSTRGTFLPVFDLSTKSVYRMIDAAGIRLPVDYEMFGRSFDGIDLRFLDPIRKRFPEDYEKILWWFPMAGLELSRRRLCPVIPSK
jgi:hypothetical protein